MADEPIDVLMKVVGTGGPYAAESSTQFKTKPVMDLLRQGFTPGQFCELQLFGFSAGVASSLSQGQQEAKNLAPGARETVARLGPGLAKPRARRVEFVDMQPVEYTRVVDSMSTLLFNAMAACETLESISIVKRKAAGTANSGDCFLRLDFSKVLLTELNWKDGGATMVETGSFIYRKLTMRYRPQRPDGSLDVAVQTEWEMKAVVAK